MRISPLTLLPLLISGECIAGDWEIKTDLKITDGAVSDVTKYKTGGAFDEREVKQKEKTKLETLLVYSDETPFDGLKYNLRLGNIIEQNRETKVELNEDGSIHKNKSRTETERINYAGIGFSYKIKNILGANRWSVKGRYDHYFDIHYGAKDLQANAKERSGSLKGNEWSVKATGEYETFLNTLFFSPYLKFKQEQRDAWIDDIRLKQQEEEKEKETEIGLAFDWIPPLAGWELNAGPYWQNEVDYERSPGENWARKDDERWIAEIKAEYEAAASGFEIEIVFAQHLNGEDQGERQLNLELSYEF
ncbi:MAG: hypothetical protein ACRBB6_10995 [Neptuniibacter sp.]